MDSRWQAAHPGNSTSAPEKLYILEKWLLWHAADGVVK